MIPVRFNRGGRMEDRTVRARLDNLGERLQEEEDGGSYKVLLERYRTLVGVLARISREAIILAAVARTEETKDVLLLARALDRPSINTARRAKTWERWLKLIDQQGTLYNVLGWEEKEVIDAVVRSLPNDHMYARQVSNKLLMACRGCAQEIYWPEIMCRECQHAQ